MRAALACALAVSGLGLVPAAAGADAVDEIGRKLVAVEANAGQLDSSVRNSVKPAKTAASAERRLVEGQVAHGVGRYADATIFLYDVVEKHPQSRAYREAIFYLADSLFHKGDNLTSRDFFHKVVDEIGESGPHYQTSLERLVELTIRIGDASRVPDYFARLDRLPPGAANRDSIAYVRGKYEHFAKNWDTALRHFDQVPPTSKYHFQARYFSGVTQVARGDLGAAAKVFQEVVRLTPKTDRDKRIVELAWLAVGRIFYERDQPSEAVDAYLKINRRSALFDEALFEVAFVYVKDKKFEEALRALELLLLADPESAMKPDVRILEGNLRIRKGQSTSQAGTGNAVEEYAKAEKVFTETRDQYEKPKQDLEKLIAAKADPRPFFQQLIGHAEGALDVQAELSPVVLEWLKQEKEVARTVMVSRDLDQVRAELDESDQILDRIDRAISAASRVTIFPELANRWISARELLETAQSYRLQLATHEQALAERYAQAGEREEYARLRDKRREVTLKMAALPHAGGSYTDRTRKARSAYDVVDKQAVEVDAVMNTMEAELVALEKYQRDQPAGKKLPQADFDAQLRKHREEIAELRKELESIRLEASIGQDEAGFGDGLAKEELALRQELSAAIMLEHGFIRRLTPRMSGEDRAKSAQIGQLMERTLRIENRLRGTLTHIEQLVDAQLVDVRATVVEERGRVGEYRKVLVAYDGENVTVGTEVVGGSLGSVVRRFYDFIIRADVGILDVAWAQKEQSQRTLDRLRLDAASEKNTLDGEFRDLKEPEPPPAETKP